MLHILLVALGGAIGSIARYGVYIFYKHFSLNPYICTIVINALASFLAGVAIYFILKSSSELWRLFIIVGILGGFSTFSSLSLDVLSLLQASKITLALLYIIAINFIGIALCALGFVLAKMLV